jgi:hypothetical protein
VYFADAIREEVLDSLVKTKATIAIHPIHEAVAVDKLVCATFRLAESDH